MAKAVHVKESTIERYLVKQFALHGAIVRKVSWLGRRGAPDRVVFVHNGGIVWVELKAPNKKPSALQRQEHARLNALGHTVHLIDNMQAVDALVASVYPAHTAYHLGAI